MSECEDHAVQSHTASGVTKELSAIIRLNKKPLDFSQGLTCPLCDVKIDSAKEYQRHVGRHQEQLALFSLPGLDSKNEADAGDEENSGVESVASDYDEISDNDDIFENDPPLPPPSMHGTSHNYPSRPDNLADTIEQFVQRYNNRATGTGRWNEYFLPRDGIDREVISADICRYLGNDATVRPGHYEVRASESPLKANIHYMPLEVT
jgi:hypothetical protein